MNVSIIGTGYVGVVTGACLAAGGHRVICVDVNADIVRQINSGHTPIHEAGLGELLPEMVRSEMLSATTDPAGAVLNTDVTFICVGTPNAASGIDLQQIVTASEKVGESLAEKNDYHVVAVKSTVLPGITEGLVKQTIEERSGRKLGDGWGLCMNPEFLRQGCAVADFMTPDRVVIGASDHRAGETLLEVYSHLDCPKVMTTPKTAEMIKYVANSLFATMISFSNEIANICSAIPNLNVRRVWEGVHLDRRLTALRHERRESAGLIEYLWHGLGFGGSCFPKDVEALRKLGKGLGQATPMLDAVLTINESQPSRLVSLLQNEIGIFGRRVAVLGLAFKPGTDDLRESPALPVVTALRKQGAEVIVHDPVAAERAKGLALFDNVSFAPDWTTALKDADACLIVTAWPEFGTIRPEDFRRLMRNPLVVDGRGLFDLEEMETAGVKWRGIGYRPEQSSLLDMRRFESIRAEDTIAGVGAALEQRDIFDLLHEAAIVRDLTGRIISWNNGAMEMYGWTQEDATGAISHELLKTKFPQPLEDIERDFVERGKWEGELVHAKKDGSLIAVKSRWVLNYVSDSEADSLIEFNQIVPLN